MQSKILPQVFFMYWLLAVVFLASCQTEDTTMKKTEQEEIINVRLNLMPEVEVTQDPITRSDASTLEDGVYAVNVMWVPSNPGNPSNPDYECYASGLFDKDHISDIEIGLIYHHMYHIDCTYLPFSEIGDGSLSHNSELPLPFCWNQEGTNNDVPVNAKIDNKLKLTLRNSSTQNLFHRYIYKGRSLHGDAVYARPATHRLYGTSGLFEASYSTSNIEIPLKRAYYLLQIEAVYNMGEKDSILIQVDGAEQRLTIPYCLPGSHTPELSSDGYQVSDKLLLTMGDISDTRYSSGQGMLRTTDNPSIRVTYRKWDDTTGKYTNTIIYEALSTTLTRNKVNTLRLMHIDKYLSPGITVAEDTNDPTEINDVQDEDDN